VIGRRPSSLRLPPLDRVLLRYLGLQVPGWILAIAAMIAVRRWVDLSLPVAAGILGLLVLKDLALYPFLRSAYASDGRHGTELLVGAHGVVTEAIGACGYVRVRGELWRAERADAAPEMPAGARVVVAAARGLTLIVRPAGASQKAAARRVT
jgi:membrane protein implicated in regulation of membrane protease activity